MSFRRVLLADVAAVAGAPLTPLQRHAGVGGVGSRVHVQGLCVWRESVGAQLLRLEIDDGTGVTLLQVRGESAAAELQEVAPGNMIKALGEVQDAPMFAAGRSWKRWIDAASVSVVDDPNAESLHVLETLLLQKTVYLKAPLATHSAPSIQPCSLPLLPLPAATSPPPPTEHIAVGEKRKLSATTPSPANRQQHQPQQQQQQQRYTSTPPSARASPARPSPQPPLLEVNATQQRGLLLQPSGHAASIPPAEYQFHVSGADLKLIATGAKTLEMRLNNPPYSIIRANDRIKFNGKLVTTVTAVRKYAQLRSALELETLSSLLPPAAPGAPAVSLNGAVRRLRQFISEAEEAAHGVAVFEFQAPPGAHSATPRTPEEWSKLIYEFVGKKGSAGCSLRDLQFAFPTLSIDKIEAMLTDLQMDAVVYLSKGTYRLV